MAWRETHEEADCVLERALLRLADGHWRDTGYRCAALEYEEWPVNLERAIEITAYAFRGQRDKSGKEPAVLHSLRVMFALSGDDEDMIVGVLHDILEDTAIDLEDLVEEGLPEELAVALQSVTRDKTVETYSSYILRVKENPRGRRVKVADLMDNLARLHQLPKSERASLEARWRRALEVLG